MAMLLSASHVSSAFLAGSRTHGNARTAVRMSVSGTVPEGTCATVVFLRHGERPAIVQRPTLTQP